MNTFTLVPQKIQLVKIPEAHHREPPEYLSESFEIRLVRIIREDSSFELEDPVPVHPIVRA